MDRSRQRGDGSGNGPGTVGISDGDLFTEGSNRADQEGHINPYAEASQALGRGRKPCPIEHAPCAQSGPPARSDESGEVSTAEPVEPEKQNQRVDTETGSVETEISAQDDRAKQTAAVIVPCLMTVEDVATYLRMSVSKVWRSRRKDPDFPQPIRLGGSTRWERLEVDHYLEVYKARRRNGR
ncbi:helix-turn-helix transcriptional regulator [Hoeflea alexandrii]|uniref:Helix-turn-helix domain-containing protein n=1 Tax=Hoeflea alexandrii TaxID=288436 RepID=A0ABT1CS99_9HYPH|nr:hypothetical protein [Hoeflea alexandrii]MCO6409057.1 hypothetical protein [Hoeflea alexandrii]